MERELSEAVTSYKSMICVPVLKGHGSDIGKRNRRHYGRHHIDRYFGRKDDRAQEDKIASMIRHTERILDLSRWLMRPSAS